MAMATSTRMSKKQQVEIGKTTTLHVQHTGTTQTLRNGQDGQGSFQKSQYMYTAKSKKVALVNGNWKLGIWAYGTMQ